MKKFTQKLACLMMVMLCCVSLQVNAQNELTVADGTATSSSVPTYGLWADTQGARSQCLYPADLLADMAGGSISQMTFYLSSPATEAWTGTFQVSVGETSDSQLTDFVDDSSLTPVYTGSMDATGATLTVVFDTPYEYNGDNLVFDWLVTVAGNYKSASFVCEAMTGAGRARTSSSASGSAIDYLPKVTFEYTVGGGPTCDRPSMLDITDVTSDQATLNWADGSGVYNVEYKKSSDDEWQLLLKGTTATDVTLTGLMPSTAYQARVQSVCGENTSSYKTVSFKTLIGIPYSDAMATQGDWTKMTGLWNPDGTTVLASGGSWGFGSHYGVLGGAHAYRNVYGSSCKDWIISPLLPLPADKECMLTFRIALTDYANADPIEDFTAQADDKFIVLATADGGESWSVLQQWDNQGSSFVYNQIATEGEEVEINLGVYAGMSIQLAFYVESTQSGGDNDFHLGDVLVDYVPSCVKPTSLHEVDGRATTSSLQIEWTANSGEENWKVQFKPSANTAEDWTTLDVTTNPYTITGLAPFTSYDIRVASYCTPAGEDPTLTDYCKPITAKTASEVPFEQSFDVASWPIEWKRYVALLEEVENGEPLERTTDGWNVSDANDIFPAAENHLVLNIAGDACNYWVVSPTIMMEAGYQLTFEMALTKENGSAVTTGRQNTHKLIALITTDGGDTWTPIGRWENSGEGFSYDAINPEGQLVSIDLSEYDGQSIMLAFYGESQDAMDDANNLHISNVKIDLIPACPRANSLTITDIEGTSATAVWEADEEGSWQYGYMVKPTGEYTINDDDFTGNTGGMMVAITDLTETTDYIFFLRRVCGASTSEVLVKEFTTIQTPATLPYSADFESNNGGWLLHNGSFANQWVWGSATANGGQKSLYVSNDNGASNAYGSPANVIYASKTFFFEEAGVYSFSYDWKANGASTSDYLRIALAPADAETEAATSLPTGLNSNSLPENWLALDGGSKLNLQEEWQSELFEVDVENAGFYKVVLVWRNDGYTHNPPAAAIDNFHIAKVSCPRPTGLLVSDIDFTGATASWNNTSDGLTWVYAVAYASAGEPADESFAPIGVNSIQLEDLEPNTRYIFYLRKACGEDRSESLRYPFKTLNPYELTIADGAATNGLVPVYGYWVDHLSGSQFIIPADSLEALMWDTITDLTFYANTSTIDWGAAQFEVYMAEAPGTSLSTLADWNSMTKVMNAAKLSVEDGKMVVSLDAPFAYEGGNLMIGVLQTVTGTYVSSNWYGISATGASLGGYDGSASQQSFLPKTTFGFKPGAAPACSKPIGFKVVADSLITANSVVLTWTPQGVEENWVVRYRESGAETWSDSVFVANDTVTIEGLSPSTVYEAQVATWCNTEDATDIGPYSASISFMTACAAVASVNEDFEESLALTCWKRIGETNSYGTYPALIINEDYAQYATSGNGFMYFLSEYGSSSNDQYLILPELLSLEGMRIRFNAAKQDATDEDVSIQVGVMTNPSDATTFETVEAIAINSTAYAQYSVLFTNYAGEGKYIAIMMPAATSSYATLVIDDVIADEIPQCFEPTALTATLTHGDGSVAQLNWVAGAEETAWIVEYATDAAFSSPEAVEADTTSLSLTGLTPETTYYARVKADCGAGEQSAWSNVISFHPTNALAFTIFDGNVNNGFVPIYGYWADNISKSQFIIPADTLASIQWATINKLTFYANEPSVAWGAAEFEVYVAEVPGTTLSALADWSAMEKVKNAAKLSVIGNKMEVVLDAPYQYLGGNLMIGILETTSGGYSTVSWFGINATGASFGGYGTSVSQQNFLPKMTIDYIPGAAPTCPKPTSLTATLTNGDGSVAQLNWVAGAEETAWIVEYATDAAFSSPVAVAADATSLSLTGLTPETTYYARVKADCGAGNQSEWSSVVSFHPTNASAITIFDGTSTNSYVPIYGLWVDDYTKSQFIIPADSLDAIHWSTINKLTFYSTNAAINWGAAKFEVYMAEVPSTTMSSMAAYTSMTKVMTAGILSISDNKMEVELDAPFAYEDGNLMIGFMQTVSGTYASCTWIGVSATGASFGGYGTSVSQQNFLPKMTIGYIPGEAPACLPVKNVQVSDIKAHSAKISWNPGEETQEQWEIAYDTLPSNEPDTLPTRFVLDTTAWELTALSPVKTYYAYVRTYCFGDGYSKWISASPFTTTVACPAVSELEISDITASSATVSWTAGDEGQDAWQIVYSADPAFDITTVSEADILDAASTQYAMAELLTDTLYRVYVRANCGGEDGVSLWNSILFRTAKACQTPDNLAAADITTNSAAISWNTYGQSGFNLRYMKGTDTVTIANVESPYTIGGLVANTTYRVQVQAACADENEWSAAFSFKTAYGIPFLEAFGTSIPADWTMYTGLLEDILGGEELTSSSYGWSFGTSNGVFDNHARVNIYGDYQRWLVTPAIEMQPNAQLTFDLALTGYYSTSTGADMTGTDDKFVVLASTDEGDTWTVLREWSNAEGAAYVYNDIAVAGEEVVIDLSAYSAGSIMLAFYGESTVSNADNNLHIDNVAVDFIPACPKPTGLNISEVLAHSAQINWTAGAEGQNAWQIAVDAIAAFNPDTLSSLIEATENPYVLSGLAPDKTYYVYVRAHCGEGSEVSPWTARASFKTTIACPAPSNLTASLTPGDGSIAVLSWLAGGEESAWIIEYSVNANMSDAISVTAENASYELSGLIPETTYYARVKADCGELDGESVYSAIISFTPTDAFELTIHDGTTTNNYVPIYGLWVDDYTRSQFIIPESDLEAIEWDSITQLTFYASNGSVNWGAAEFEVYMAEASATTMSELADWSAMEKVMNAASLSIVDNKMVVTLSEPYAYQGGNLRIGFNQTVSGSYVSCSWYGETVSGASFGGYGNNVSQQNFLPKMTIGYIPGEAPACQGPRNLSVSDITAEGATFTWKAIEDAIWQYGIALAGSYPESYSSTGANSIVIDGLDEDTEYEFFLMRDCEPSPVSIAFKTDVHAEALPYAEDFNALHGWKFANDATNAWMIGTEASEEGNALYISNDGASYAYDEDAEAISFAYKLFNFDSNGVYNISYDWKAVGEFNDEDGALDFMRAALVPASVSLTAGVQPIGLTDELLPDGWIGLDGMNPLVAHADWVHQNVSINVEAGLYKIVFIWINDDALSDGAPAAIDNLSIERTGWITDIEGGAGIETRAIKFMKNNQVYILVNGTVYSITGQKVEVK